MSINKVFISGNLTNDMEVRYTNSGMAVAQGGIAVNERVKDQAGNWTDKPHFFDLVFFGKRAESLSQYLVKGTKVAIDGRLRYSTWEKVGQKRSKVEIVIDEIELMSRGNQQQQQQPRQQQYQQPQYRQPQYQQPSYSTAPMYEDDIPF